MEECVLTNVYNVAKWVDTYRYTWKLKIMANNLNSCFNFAFLVQTILNINSVLTTDI